MTQDPDGLRFRADRQAAQAWAFDRIGEHYDEAFPHKEGQIAAGEWLLERLGARLARARRRVRDGNPDGAAARRRRAQVTGIDISEEMLRLARRDVPEAEFRHLDITDLEPSMGDFSAVVAFFSLLMLPRADIPPVLGKIHDRPGPGGYFLLSMVEADLDDTPIHFLGSPVRVTGYIRDELRELVTRGGLRGPRPAASVRTLRPAPSFPRRCSCSCSAAATAVGEVAKPRAGGVGRGTRAPRVPPRRDGAHRR